MTIRILGCSLFVVCLGAISCRPAEQIEAYNVPKETAPTVVPAAASSKATDRMLAAVLPDGERAWFLKVNGPAEEVDSRADQIAAFLASVRLAAGKPHPDWKIPEVWQEQPGSGMRAATLLIPTSAKPLELSVTALPWSGAPGELLSNVNRWRGQMQLAATDEQGLAECTREIKAGDVTMTVVDLRGSMSGGMMPPFAGGPMSNSTPPATMPEEKATNDLPPGHPAVVAQDTADASPFKYDAPEGWQPRPASGIRKAEFRIEDGGKTAVVTAIDFPADSPPMMSDPLANVKRWRGEVGMPTLADEEIQKTMQPLEIDGIAAISVDAVPDASQPDQSQTDRGTLAAMLTRGDTIWFFKLSGDRDLVAAQRDNFQTFLKSLRFKASGAGNVN
jgi:hypothetical protein